MNKSNIFQNIPKKFEEEFFEEIVAKENLKIERIVSFGHTTGEDEWYDQESDEWVILLQGEAILSFEEGQDVALFAGDYINIPAHKKHRVAWTKENVQTIWLAVHY